MLNSFPPSFTIFLEPQWSLWIVGCTLCTVLLHALIFYYYLATLATKCDSNIWSFVNALWQRGW